MRAEGISGGGGGGWKVSDSTLNMASLALDLKSLNAFLLALEDILQLHDVGSRASLKGEEEQPFNVG